MPDCSGHGVCEDGVCVCIKGYKGEFCQEGKLLNNSLSLFFVFVLRGLCLSTSNHSVTIYSPVLSPVGFNISVS